MGLQLRLLFGLYVRPRRALAAIMDEGSIIFGAIAVLLVAGLFEAGGWARYWGDVARAVGPAAHAARPAEPAADSGDPPTEGAPPGPAALLGTLASTSALTTVVGLAVLYAPSLLFALTLLEPIGSFGVAFRRDFGALLACTFDAWAATHLPFALATLPIALLVTDAGFGWLLILALRGVAGLAFVALMVPALRTVFGARAAASLAASLLAFLPYAMQGMLAWLASPFLLYYLWLYFRGDLSDVGWSLSARRSMKRHLEAATVNPRDADAHVQLGLIHLRRRQVTEARGRFERAIEIDPDEVDAHFQLGRLARLDARWEDAIRHFEGVVAKDERYSHHEVWREIGATYLGSGSLEHAHWALEKFTGQRPHDPEGLCLLGDALLALERRDEARARFQAAIEAADTTPGYRRHEVREWRKHAARRLGAV